METSLNLKAMNLSSWKISLHDILFEKARVFYWNLFFDNKDSIVAKENQNGKKISFTLPEKFIESSPSK